MKDSTITPLIHIYTTDPYIDITEMQKLPRDSISGTIYIKKSTENDRNMQEFLEDCKAKVLLETLRKLKDSNNK